MKTELARINESEKHPQMLTVFVNGARCSIEFTKNNNLSCVVWKVDEKTNKEVEN
jgi:hypothetical protein